MTSSVYGYLIRVRFADGVVGNVDLADERWGEVFEPLKNLEVFRDFRLDVELNTVTWANGADFAPEYLYEKAVQHASGSAERR